MHYEFARLFPWLKKLPMFYVEHMVVNKRISEYDENIQILFINDVLGAIEKYYGGIKVYSAKNSQMEGRGAVETARDIEEVISTWINGLWDLYVVSVLTGLASLVMCKTKYIDWPPSSVIQFRKICETADAHVEIIKPPFALLEFDHDEAKKRSDLTSAMLRLVHCLNNKNKDLMTTIYMKSLKNRFGDDFDINKFDKEMLSLEEQNAFDMALFIFDQKQKSL